MVGTGPATMESGLMTCIVGITDGQTVTIGGDSAGSDGWHVAVRSDSKVFQVGSYLMGFTTSYRMGQLLRYSLAVGDPDTWDIDRFMATTFIDAVRDCLSRGGYAKTEDGQEQGGQFLVGIHGRLYVVGDDYQIGHTISGYAAVGSGYLVALGSLHSTARSPADSRQRAVLALEAAAELTEGVRPPFTVVQSG
jgi:20S proteasome alpha/beta subunit